jgi:hypothetical protein
MADSAKKVDPKDPNVQDGKVVEGMLTSNLTQYSKWRVVTPQVHREESQERLNQVWDIHHG